MPAPPARRPAPSRRPVHSAKRAKPGRSSLAPWLVALAVALSGAAGGAAWWLTRSGAATPSAPAVGVAEPQAAAVVEQSVAPAAVSDEQVGGAVAEVPILSPEAARALLGESLRRAEAASHPLDRALFVASVGFADLDRATLDELGRLFNQGWGTRSAADQARIQAYLQYARAGEPLAPDAVARGRTLVGESVRALPAPARGRLQELFARAVLAGITHRQQAEERARVAALTPLPAFTPPPEEKAPGPPRPTPPGGNRPAVGGPVAGSTGVSGSESASGARGESYWRARARNARAQLEAAEKRVQDLEAQAAKDGLVAPGPLPPACQASAPSGKGGHPSGTILGPTAFERTKNVKVCDYEILRQQQAQTTQRKLEAAREALERAKKDYEAFEDEARRGGALPGWLR